MGSFENSVMVNETSCVSISGLHSCSELSHPIVDSEMGLASAPDKCTACDFGSSCLSSGDATQTCSVEGDGLEDENKDVDVLGLENLLLDDSGQGAGGLVDKIHSGIGAHETESGQECLQEGSSVSRDGSVGEHKDVDVLGLENFSKNDSLVCGGGLDDSHSDTDVREKESGGECIQDRSSFSREGLVGDCEAVDVLLLENMLRNDSGHSGVFWDKNLNDIDIIREKESGGECLQEDTSGGRDGSGGKLKAVDILRLENLAENDSRHSGGCLGDDHNGIDFHEKESGGKCLQEGISLSRDGSGGEFEAVDNLLVENYSENGSGHRVGCLDENHDDIDVREKESGRQCLQEDISLSRDGSEVEHEVLDNLQLENLLVNDPGHSGGCLDENHIVVDIDEKERGGECLRDGSSVSGDGLVGEYEAALVSLLENLLKNESGVSGACLDENQSNIDACNAESRGDCLQEGKLRGQDDLGNQIRDCEIHSEVITVAELPINCVQLDEQKDEKGVCCLSSEEILEAREDKDDVLAKVSNDLCELEPPSQDHESSESSPDNDNLVNTLEQKEQNLESVGDFSLGNVTGNSTIDCSGQRDDQVNDNEGVNFVSEAKRCGTASSSQKNSRKSRSNRKTPTEKATRKCKKTTKVLCPNGFIKVTFKATKKRSCLSKSARSSAWGLLGNVTQLFEHSNGLEVIQVPDQGPQKPKGGKQSRKQNKKGAHVRSQGSRKKSSPSTTKIRLKVKLGKGVDQGILNLTVPKVVDNTALSTAISRDDRTERCTSSPKVANGEVDDYKNSEVSMQFRCVSSKGDKVTSCPDASVQDSELVNNDLDTNVVTKKLDTDARDDYFGICPNSLVEASGEATESRCKDPGTSPDSEVINLIPDAHIDSRPCDDFHAAVASPKDLADPGDLISNKRGKKKSKPSGLVSSTTEHKSPLPVRINKAKPLKQYGRKQNSNNGICPAENLTFLTSAKASSNSSSDEQPSVVEPLPLSVETALRVSAGALKMETGAEAKIHCKLDDDVGLSKSQTSENFLSPPKPNGRKVPKGKSKGSDLGTKRGNSRNKRETQHSFYGKKKAREQHVSDQIAFKVESQPEAENPMVDDKGKANSSKDIAFPDVFNSGVPPAALGEQYLPQRLAWVRCDSCTKWRRIPAEVADTIDEQCSWTCKDNKDKAFADCSIPQEKSNKDINLELEISDASGEEDASNYKGLQCRSRRDLQETPICISIRTNQYLHRGRKTQTIDEIMVCHCKRHSDGQLGCGDDCLNRMLNIECVQGACPCGDLCSNQQFQKRKYAKLGKFQCGKKGYGLRLLEDISQGKFLIEYVGEVLDMQAYEARQKKYASKGHKHFYFMTLNGSEVIDACIKGNKGRFINHSCDPNCRTEKWMVNGEICIGLFALRDIKKGEEVTFDYNYVRVFGAAAKKCYCGSPQCRGYIGGDPLNGDVIIQSDSDEDHPERKMLRQKIARKPSSSVIKKTSESTLDHIDEKDKRTPPVVQSEISPRKEDSMNSISYVHDVLELDSKEILSSSVQPSEIFQQTEDVTSELVSTAQQESNMEEETTENSPSSSERLDLTPPAKAHIKSLSDSVDSIRKSKSADDQRLSTKAHPKVKTSRASSFVKKEKIRSGPPNTCKVEVAANKSLVLHTKPKKVVEGSFGNNFEAVEEKLNELLDADGGISKRKDASKGYLKLLLLTAASGGSANGEAIQRNRDLSMILDALLKTKSRVVLIDIINKNGLRMLHNIMKQYRRDFKKIPILRKLLKVLEYLAVREILTPEHINGGPPCPGMESFRQSILRLTDHDDRQVHQIARNFRDRWIPKNFRKLGFVDRDDNKTESPRSTNFNRYSARQDSRSDHYGRHAETTDRVKQLTPATTLVDTGIHEGSSGSSVGVSPTNGTKTRKRKSRWDQPAETSSDLIAFQPKEQQIESLQFESTVHRQDKLNGEGSNCPGSVSDCCHFEKANTFLEVKKNILEDVPPGFSSPRKPPPGSSVASSTVSHSQCNLDTVIGHPQQKFISRLPVSYGIPLSIMQQFGTHAENAGSWVIAPGMPFHPFPPLPPYPRDKKQPSPSDDMKRLSVNQPAEEAQPDSHLPATSNSNECTPSTTGDQPDAEMLCTNNHYTMKRGRESSQDLGRRYFKQQKWNNTKLEPPWHLRKNGWGCMGDSRDRASGSLSIENIANEHRSTYCSEDSSCTVEKAGNGTFQHPEHHSQH